MNRLGPGASFTLLAVICAVVAALALLSTYGPQRVFAYGNGDGTSNTHTLIGTPVPFSLNYSTQLKGDYVAAGVGMRASGPPGGGTITLGAVPGGSTITKAFLYWSVINSTSSPSLAMGSINGNAITGTNYATTASPCWDSPVARQIYNFVADVTSFASFGVNTLTGFASGGPPTFPATEPLLEGATLVVVYQNAALQNHQVDIYQGARSFSGPPIETLTMSGYTAVAGASQTSWVVADGQPNSPPFNNKTYVDGGVTQTGVLNGSEGNFWDTNTQNVTANIPPGDTSIQVGAESSFDFGSGDCITWVAQVLSTPAQEPATPTPSPSPSPAPTTATPGPPAVGGIVQMAVGERDRAEGVGSGDRGGSSLQWLALVSILASAGLALGMLRRRSRI